MTKVGILLISTWKYNKFIQPTIYGIRKFLFRNSDTKIFLHTDSNEQYNVDKTIHIEHKPWPLITLFRYQLFNDFKECYKDVDYLLFLDIDIHIRLPINEDILHDFFVLEHWYYKNRKGTPDTNPKSTAYINPKKKFKYVAGGFVGGKTDRFLSASETMSKNIDQDYKNNIIALWHDESHLNRYVLDNRKSVTILDCCYMSYQTRFCDNPKIVPYNNDKKGFDKFENMIHK